MTQYIDTNILVRLMTNDVPTLAKEAIEQIKKSRSGELIVIDAVLVELLFILEVNQQYKLPREKIVLIFEGILSIPQLKLSESSITAFNLYASNKKLDFTDCLLATLANNKKERVITFDKDLQNILK